MLSHPAKLFTEVCSSPSITNGHALNVGAEYFKAGHKVQFSCNEGFSSPHSTTTCQAAKVWSPPPVCTVVTCNVPSLNNGRYTTGHGNRDNASNTSYAQLDLSSPYWYNTTIAIICNEGYEMKGGSATRACQSDGTWGQPPLECVKILCNDTSDVRHEHIDHYPELAIGENGTVSYNSEHIFLSSGYTIVTCSTSRKLKWIKAPEFGKIFITKHVHLAVQNACSLSNITTLGNLSKLSFVEYTVWHVVE